jgi:micrococcal nuclease
MYIYNAKVTDVYDGDTVTVDLDLGCNIWLRNEKIRLYHINAPELRGEEKPEGIKSRDWLRKRILGKEVLIQTIKDKRGKYGRLLGIIWEKESSESINSQMVKEGLAEEKEY